MKIIHMSDLHLGKRLNEISLIEDQEYILKKILTAVKEEAPGAVIIAGDVYDKAVPSAEAVALFDDFLFNLTELGTEIFVISGNHDSAERIAFGSRMLDKSGIHMSPVFTGSIEATRIEDEYGTVAIYMLPFIKPANVRRFCEDRELKSYTEAIDYVISGIEKRNDERNILVAHQFVTGSSRSESEEISVGGTDNVDASVFSGFDYTALGHLHKPQNCRSERIRYSGSPLKYSFSESGDEKSLTLIELGEKGEIEIRTIALNPLRDMVELKGSYDKLTMKSFYEGTGYRDDYVHITLTDEEDVPEAMNKLRVIYRNLMKLDYDNARTRASGKIEGAADTELKTPFELFSDFYVLQNNAEMDAEKADFIERLIEEIREGKI